MRLMIAVAALALTACGGAELDEPMEAEFAETAADTASAYSGTYAGQDEQGVPWSTTLSPDGTFVDAHGGEVTRTGTWTEDANGICFVDDGAPAGAEPECFQMGEIDENGDVTVTAADGSSFVMNKTG